MVRAWLCARLKSHTHDDDQLTIIEKIVETHNVGMDEIFVEENFTFDLFLGCTSFVKDVFVNDFVRQRCLSYVCIMSGCAKSGHFVDLGEATLANESTLAVGVMSLGVDNDVFGGYVGVILGNDLLDDGLQRGHARAQAGLELPTVVHGGRRGRPLKQSLRPRRH